MRTQSKQIDRLLWNALVVLVFAGIAPLSSRAEECASSWTHIMRYYPPVESFWGVCNNGSKFVTVGQAGIVCTSSDGITWTEIAQKLGGPHYGITYGNGLFVTCGWNSMIHTSTNGVNWTQRVSNVPATIELFGIVYNPDAPLFVVGGGNGNGATSPDGITWTGFDAGSMHFRSIAYHDGVYVACGGYNVHRSTNGRNWTTTTIHDQYLFCVTHAEVNGTDMFIVGGGPGAIFASTNNGITWTRRTTPSGLGYLMDATFTGTHFVVVGYKEGTTLPYCPVLTSPDGIVWTLRDSKTTLCQWLWGVSSMNTGSGSIVVSVGHTGTIVRSTCSFAPLITQDPQDQTRCQGSSVQFCVTVVGETPFSYQWQNWNGSSWTNISGAQSACYTINPISTSHDGYYRCRVWNEHGETLSNSATLTVRTAPSSFSQQPSNQTLCEWAPMTLCAQASNGSSPLYYQWQRHTGSSWTNIVGAYSNCYTLDHVHPSDAGQYRCYVSNDCGGTASAVGTLTVTARTRADFDCDTDVDQEDFGHFQMCLSGQEAQNDPACQDADLNDDTYVDQNDFSIFLNCMAGPNREPNC